MLLTELRTPRLRLRPWRAADAERLLPVLEANREHLGPWIPKRIAEPAPIGILEQRLTGFAEDFAADRAWRFAVFPLNGRHTLGEVGLFPRAATGRVHLADADRAEIGYWLRGDFTGQGLIAEAARAVLALAATVPQFSHAEIHCDARNAPSVGVARRLGFALTAADQEDEEAADALRSMQVWTLALKHAAGDLAPA